MFQLCWIPGSSLMWSKNPDRCFFKTKRQQQKTPPKHPYRKHTNKKLAKTSWLMMGSCWLFTLCFYTDILHCFVIPHIYHTCISGTPKLFWGVSVIELHWEVGNRYTWINMSLLVCGCFGAFFGIAWFLFCLLLISWGSLWGESLKCFYLPHFSSHESIPGKHKLWFLLDETRQDCVPKSNQICLICGY